MILDISKKIINQEAKALLKLSNSLDTNFSRTLNIIIKSKGNIFLSGVGKSGHIARKIASTFTSTGRPAFFLHPTEASHGDLGLLRKNDIIILLSNSGKSKELLDLVNYAKKNKIISILLTANAESKLSKISSHIILLPNLKEAGKNNIAPTTSTTMMLALGDAIALSVSEKKKFTKNQFGEYHPGGNIGASFLMVKDIMHKNKQIPLTRESTNMKEVIIKITRKNFGCIGVIDKYGSLRGVITDGDLRRHMSPELLKKSARDIMSLNPKTINLNTYVFDALKIINNNKITSLFVLKDNKKKIPMGIIHLHDCLGFKNEIY